MRIAIEHYIATNNPAAVDNMFAKRGIPSAKNLPDAINKIRMILKKEGDSAAKELASINTPYQQMIAASQDVQLNACGCSGADGSEKKSNCCGVDGNGNSEKEQKTEPTEPTTQTPSVPIETAKEKIIVEDKMTKAMPYVAVGLLLVVTTAILIKK